MSEMHISSRNPMDIRRKRRKTPLMLHSLRLLFRFAGSAMPSLLSPYAYRLWFRTYRHTPPPREAKLTAKSAYHTVKSGPHTIRVYSWGTGPVVMLVHGWNGRGAQLGQFIEPLLSNGYRVVTFDAPAHGMSSGKSTTLFEMADAMREVARWFGPVEAIIAHSFGVTVAVHAVATGLDVQRIVALSPPATMHGLFDKFSSALRLPHGVRKQLAGYFEKDFGHTIWDMASTAQIVQKLSTPGLIIHDRDDIDVPWQEAEIIQQNWRDSDLLLTQKMGHRRILRSQYVINQAIDYIQR